MAPIRMEAGEVTVWLEDGKKISHGGLETECRETGTGFCLTARTINGAQISQVRPDLGRNHIEVGDQVVAAMGPILTGERQVKVMGVKVKNGSGESEFNFYHVKSRGQ